MAILVPILCAAMLGAKTDSLELTLRPQSIKGSVTLGYEAKINGHAVMVSIVLALKDNYIHEDLAAEMSIRGRDVETAISFAEKKVTDVPFIVEAGNWQGVILGRSFFENSILRWNTSDHVITVLPPDASRDGGFPVDIQSGFFKVLNEQFPLPCISNNTVFPSDEPLKGAFRLAKPGEEFDSAPVGVPVIGLLNGQLQSINGIKSEFGKDSIFGTKFRQGMPGASFFGAQTVEIDFKNSRIFFDPSPALRGAFILGYRLGLDLKVQEGRLVLVGTRPGTPREKLQELGIFGFYVESFGEVKMDVSQLGDVTKIREFLLAIEKEKFMRLSDGENSFILRFN